MVSNMLRYITKMSCCIIRSKKTLDRNMFSKNKTLINYLGKFCNSFHSGNSFNKGPLTGIRVCDMSRVLAGPYCAMILGDLGAEVIKVERPGIGDETRTFGPPFVDDQSYYFISVNRNKKSVVVDMAQPEGLNIIYEIVKKSDVFLENFVPGKLQSLGLSYADLAKINPRLIYCSITGYGNRGPDMKKSGYDITVSAIGGGLNCTGEENGRPMRIGVATTDIVTGMFAHSAIISALYRRLKTNKGGKIDLSLLQTQINILHSLATNHLNTNSGAERLGSAHPSISPYQAFVSKDDSKFVVAADSDEYFRNLCIALTIPKLHKDERFSSNSQRVKNRKQLAKILQDMFLHESTEYWIDLLKGLGVPCGKVNNIKESFEENEAMVQQLYHSIYGSVRVPQSPVDYDGENTFQTTPSPRHGEHTANILKDLLGFSEDDIAKLMESDVIQCN